MSPRQLVGRCSTAMRVHRDRADDAAPACRRRPPSCRSGRAGSRRRNRPARSRSRSRARRRSGARSPCSRPARGASRARGATPSEGPARARRAAGSPPDGEIPYSAIPQRTASKSRLRRSGACPRCSRGAASRRPSPAVASRNRSICARVNSGSDSADARWLITPTTSRVGAGSSESPHRPMPVSSLRCVGTPSGTRPSAATSSSVAVARHRELVDRPHDQQTRSRETPRAAAAPRRASRRTAPTRLPRARRARRRPRRGRTRRP